MPPPVHPISHLTADQYREWLAVLAAAVNGSRRVLVSASSSR